MASVACLQVGQAASALQSGARPAGFFGNSEPLVLRPARLAGAGFSRARPQGGLLLRASARSSGGGLGGTLLDRPDTERRSETRKRKPPIYRVLLHNDDFNKREYVVKVLMKVVQCTVDDAVNIMQEAHSNGLALVTMCAQEVAEEYCEGLRGAGLISTMEPAGSGGAA